MSEGFGLGCAIDGGIVVVQDGGGVLEFNDDFEWRVAAGFFLVADATVLMAEVA